jgi:hypothetical protein
MDAHDTTSDRFNLTVLYRQSRASVHLLLSRQTWIRSDVSRASGAGSGPFFAIVRRDGGMIFLKGSGDPLPNPKRYSWARWDAYLNVPDPDTLAVEFSSRNTAFSKPLKDTHDGVRGFEITDPDGHVLFFGRPRK